MAQAKKRTDWKGAAAREKESAIRWEREAERLKREVDKKAAESKKNYSVTVYCTNCLCVNAVSVPPGVRIDEGDCINCRVRKTLLLVREVKSQ